jgi:N-acetylglutamate synthase-like GNAT family acetyltransferase
VSARVSQLPLAEPLSANTERFLFREIKDGEEWLRDEVDAILSHYGMIGFDRMDGLRVVCMARDTGEVIGVGALNNLSEDAWLNCIAVRGDHHRQGIGSDIVTWLINQTTKTVWLETMFWNRRFYASLGFEHVPIREAEKFFEFEPRCQKNTMVMRLTRHNWPDMTD